MDIPRKYQPVWEQIKTLGFCEISAHRAHHPRIRKALRKEKDLDYGYKLHCTELEPPIRAWVRVTQKGAVLRFTLIKSPLITVDTV